MVPEITAVHLRG